MQHCAWVCKGMNYRQRQDRWLQLQITVGDGLQAAAAVLLVSRLFYPAAAHCSTAVCQPGSRRTQHRYSSPNRDPGFRFGGIQVLLVSLHQYQAAVVMRWHRVWLLTRHFVFQMVGRDSPSSEMAAGCLHPAGLTAQPPPCNKFVFPVLAGGAARGLV